MKKVFIKTLGCKVNQYESAAFKAGLEDNGLYPVQQNQEADVVVINTCAVTANAGAQSRQAIRKALRHNPSAKIIITGCYAEIASTELSKERTLQGRDYSIIGNGNKDKLVANVLARKSTVHSNKTHIIDTVEDAQDICRLPLLTHFKGRSRAYLRVQDGCENFCSYCIIPYTRGASRSLPIQEVIDQAKIFAQTGHSEIVLTGIHLGNYGKDLAEKHDIVSLLDQLTLLTPEIYYRLSSLEPLEIGAPLLALMQDRKNIQAHLHIPLQSGHNEILRRMNRRYTVEQFRDLIARCLTCLPDLAIGIDMLAGFPGETEQHFTATKAFLQSLDFTYLHVFPYSIRPGTVAAGFTDQISKQIKDVRVAELRAIGDEKRTKFYQRQLGKVRPVLVEGRRSAEGMLKGMTDNYIAIHFNGPSSLLNSVVPVKLLCLKEGHVIGERVMHHEN